MENEGLTIRELVSYFFKRKLLVLILFIVLTLVSVLSLLIIKPKRTTYKASFMVAFQDIQSNKYPDGSFFSFKNIISYDSLVNAKNSSSEFSSINVDEIYKNNAFTIENTDTSTNMDKNFFALTFEIKVGSKYFESMDQAASYVKYLIESNTYDKVNQYYNNFVVANYLSDVNDSTEYVIILSKINNMIKLLENELTRAIEATSIDYQYDEHKTLAMLKAEFEVFIKSLDLSSVEEDYNTHLYERKDKDTTAKDFEASVQRIISGLETYRKEIQLARNEALKETNFIFYDSNEVIVTETSGLSIMKNGIISLAVGIFGSLILTLCYGAYEEFAPVKKQIRNEKN